MGTDLKSRFPKIKELTSGIINLSAVEGSVYKKTLICRTGVFMGMYGPVTVTKEKLELVADKYNKQRSKPANKFDFAPILKDHERKVDNVLGRVVAPLSVESWTDPETEIEGYGLFGNLRLDDADGKKNVDAGKYSQVSMSFDDEGTYELYEVSFVAVEAARRSQALSQGENDMNLEQQLATLTQSNTALAAKLSARKLKSTELSAQRKVARLSLDAVLVESETDVTALAASLTDLRTSLKTTALKAEFKGFITTGRMTKAEFDKLNVAELAALPKGTVLGLLDSYRNRPISSDVIQHGQTGAKQVDLSKISPAQMRQLMADQKAGKTVSSLGAAADETIAKDENGAGSGTGNGASAGDKKEEDGKGAGVKFEDIDEVMGKLEGMLPSFDKVKGHMKKLSDISKKLGEYETEKEEDAA